MTGEDAVATVSTAFGPNYLVETTIYVPNVFEEFRMTMATGIGRFEQNPDGTFIFRSAEGLELSSVRVIKVDETVSGGGPRYRVHARQEGGSITRRMPEMQVVRTMDGRPMVLRRRWSSRATPYLPDFTSRAWEGA